MRMRGRGRPRTCWREYPSHLALNHPSKSAGHMKISATSLPLNASLMTLIKEQNRMEQIKSNCIFMDATALFSTARFVFFCFLFNFSYLVLNLRCISSRDHFVWFPPGLWYCRSRLINYRKHKSELIYIQTGTSFTGLTTHLL